MKKFYEEIAQLFNAWEYCVKKGNHDWELKHSEKIDMLCKEYLPHGSGFDDGGVKFDWDNSKENRLVFTAGFHHMDEYGGYDRWSSLKIVLRPSLMHGYDMTLTGIDRKYRWDRDFFFDTLHYAFNREIVERL